MNFSQALAALKLGSKVKRAHWGGYWFIPNDVLIVSMNKPAQKMNKMIVACLKDDGGFISATPYQDDLLAEDWSIVLD